MNNAQHLNALPPDYRLKKYELKRVLGAGGFGITYLGHDSNLDRAVAIKEYLPSDLATRTDSNSVSPLSEAEDDDFNWGKNRFLDEARTLAKFNHSHIVKVYDHFKSHNTAYIVMEYVEGETLSAYLRRKWVLTEDELETILFPLLDGLEVVHSKNFLHRDIKPDNIIIRVEDNSPVLIDFGAARMAIGAKSRSLTEIVTAPYAPIEQYSSRGDQGPWTDIYALGAVCYRALTGAVPPDALGRVRCDDLVPVSDRCKGRESQQFLAAIDHALQADKATRPQTVSEWRDELFPPKPDPDPKHQIEIEDRITELGRPEGIALDVKRKKMYWTDSDTRMIQCANLDGKQVEDLITTGLENPVGIALDGRGKMYWTDSDTRMIQCANLDGTEVKPVITTGLMNPVGIALDVERGKMYWTDSVTNKIQRANLDGEEVKDLITKESGLSAPFGIALDVEREKMYWIDSDLDKGTGKIQCANLDGTEVEDLITVLGDPRGIALDVERGKMYWTDLKKKIQCANLDGTEVEDLITTRLGMPKGIALDVGRGKMYWTDVDEDTKKILRANIPP